MRLWLQPRHLRLGIACCPIFESVHANKGLDAIICMLMHQLSSKETPNANATLWFMQTDGALELRYKADLVLTDSTVVGGAIRSINKDPQGLCRFSPVACSNLAALCYGVFGGCASTTLKTIRNAVSCPNLPSAPPATDWGPTLPPAPTPIAVPVSYGPVGSTGGGTGGSTGGGTGGSTGGGTGWGGTGGGTGGTGGSQTPWGMAKGSPPWKATSTTPAPVPAAMQPVEGGKDDAYVAWSSYAGAKAGVSTVVSSGGSSKSGSSSSSSSTSGSIVSSGSSSKGSSSGSVSSNQFWEVDDHDPNSYMVWGAGDGSDPPISAFAPVSMHQQQGAPSPSPKQAPRQQYGKPPPAGTTKPKQQQQVQAPQTEQDYKIQLLQAQQPVPYKQEPASQLSVTCPSASAVLQLARIDSSSAYLPVEVYYVQWVVVPAGDIAQGGDACEVDIVNKAQEVLSDDMERDLNKAGFTRVRSDPYGCTVSGSRTISKCVVQ